MQHVRLIIWTAALVETSPASMGFHNFQGLMDQLTQVEALPLRIVDQVSQVLVLFNVEAESGEDLAIVGNLNEGSYDNRTKLR